MEVEEVGKVENVQPDSRICCQGQETPIRELQGSQRVLLIQWLQIYEPAKKKGEVTRSTYACCAGDWLEDDSLGCETRYSLKCQSSWLALASTATRIIERPARRDGERLRGKIAFAELPNGIDDRRLTNPTPCGIRKNKDQLFRSHNAESRMEHPAFAKQSSLVDETGIEPATSSLRTVGKIS